MRLLTKGEVWETTPKGPGLIDVSVSGLRPSYESSRRHETGPPKDPWYYEEEVWIRVCLSQTSLQFLVT